MTIFNVLSCLFTVMFLTTLDILPTSSSITNLTPSDLNIPAEGTSQTSSPTETSLGDVTTLRSLSERRCFNGYDCQHGVCSPSQSRCDCDLGWTGVFCHIPCVLNCGENGVCEVFANDTAFCNCDFGFKGSLCEEKADVHNATDTPQQTTATDPPITEDGDSCVSGFPCFHGHCPAGQPSCVCDEGWIGPFCQTACSLDCGSRGTCGIAGGRQVCFCEFGYTGLDCSKQVSATSVSISTTENHDTANQISPTIQPTSPTFSTTSTSSTTPSGAQPIDDLRPLSERQCIPGFVCKHGFCPKGQFKCICDEGWEGIFCQTSCALDCGQYGQCVVTPAGQRCACVLGLTGPKCGSVVNITVPESITSSPGPTVGSTNFQDTTAVKTPFFNTNTTLRPLSVRQCVPGSTAFVCKHGTCFKGPKNKTTIIGSVLECVCDPGWIGVFCHEPCPLDCRDHGRCNVFKNGTVYCSCTHEYMGPRCEKVRPKPKPVMHTPTWHWWVVGSCVFLLFILLILLIILPYLLWKRRFIFIMKIVYMFQPFEDDDDKMFDAFVSYKSTKMDEDFVVHTLYPKLEKRLKFKLCLHFRDFVPGETIANNIINAVENSRRTIMILTPSYIQSEFCRFEYQRAQHEMLKRKQRIIPIVLQDISKDRIFMDETLRTILDTITYIEWPTESNDKKIDKFWKRVELSMPKKRTSSSVGNNNDNTSDAYNAESYSFPMHAISNTPPNDWTPRGFDTTVDSFNDSGDDFHSINLNDDSDVSQTIRNGVVSNDLHNGTKDISRKSNMSL